MAQNSNNKATSQPPANKGTSPFEVIAQSRLFSALVALVVLVLVVITGVAFAQGRSISFWPPSIGALPTTATQPATPTILTATTGTTASGQNDNVLLLDNLPFIAFAWVEADNQSEKGSASLNIINDTSFQKRYQLEYTLPPTSTKYSGAGVTFKFNDPQNPTEYNPQDFTKYNYISINITFKSNDTRCDLILLDISDKAKSVALSPNTALNPDIERRRNGLTETFTIPLDTYFGDVSRKYIREMSCATDTNISPGSHTVTINSITFSKQK